jgi:transcription elongation factor GreA
VDEDTDEEKTFQIVGEEEANITKGKLSIASPLAKSLIGKKKGDSVEVRAPKGSKYYEILTVKFC